VEPLIALAWGVGALALLTLCIHQSLRLRQKVILRNLSDEELNARVFRFEPRYFDYIGSGDAAVLEFRRLVDTRDVRGIKARWASLQRSFLRLERRAGHKGRPLVLKYYNWYELGYRELMRRRRSRLLFRDETSITPGNRRRVP
jgi:hypothetical protein